MRRAFCETHVQNKTKSVRGYHVTRFAESNSCCTHEWLLDSFSDRGSSLVAKLCRWCQRPPLEGHLAEDGFGHVLILSTALANGPQQKVNQKGGFLTVGVLSISLHQHHLPSTGSDEAWQWRNIWEWDARKLLDLADATMLVTKGRHGFSRSH